MNSRHSEEFEKVATHYRSTGSLRETSSFFGFSLGKCRKILITTGDYSSPLSLKVAGLLEEGQSPEEISSELGISNAAVNSYLPYSKGIYNADAPSTNSLAIRKWREAHSIGKTE